MTPEQFEQKLRQNREALKQAIRRTIPVKMGNAAERHFKDNFRGAAGSYKTLLSGRNHLYNSVRHRVEPARAVVYNKVEYAAVHNEGLRAGRGKGFTMPRRQFIGKSKALDGKIRKIITTTINDIL